MKKIVGGGSREEDVEEKEMLNRRES